MPVEIVRILQLRISRRPCPRSVSRVASGTAPHPDAISEVTGAGALWGVFLDGGPRLLDLLAKVAPVGMARDPQFKTKVVTCAVVNALYQDHDIYSYYTLNGRNPLVLAPSLVTDPADVERAIDALDQTLHQGLGRLTVRFVKEKVSSLW